MKAEVKFIIDQLKEAASEKNRVMMQHFGINNTAALGVRVPAIRLLAKQIKTDHPLALALWQTNIHEARLLASMLADPQLISSKLMDDWVNDFNSWDLCDQCCGNLFVQTKWVDAKIIKYSKLEKEFVKRTAFVLMAVMAVHRKELPNAHFLPYFPMIEAAANDERNFVKKAVNWALRQIGKRNEWLLEKAIASAQRIDLQETKSAKWIAKDALREFATKKRKQQK
jgi:3-methyladenine DNA glycosylase AlkD